MRLIVAEKPSIARLIAGAIGATDKKDGRFEGNGTMVSWCRGHLVVPAMPEDYGPEYKKWSLEALPILPDPFKTKPDAKSADVYRNLKSLMSRADVDEVVNACDADREGELIFRLVYESIGCRKPVKRLWISSTEPSAVVAGLESMRDGSEYDHLADAAKGRQRADWIVGMNLSRLYTKLYGTIMKCGRVQTPTVCEIVRRQQAIDAFKPVPYYDVVADLGGFSVSCRMEDRDAAYALSDTCPHSRATVTKSEKKSKSDRAPSLYNLTELQKDANSVLGLSAKQTLDIAQSLYEKQLSTYPRTDSKYIAEDMVASMPEIVAKSVDAGIAPEAALQAIELDYKRLANDSKVESHPAITPTASVNACAIASLSDDERRVLVLIAHRLVAAASPPHEYISTIIETELENELFSARGRMTVKPGWREVDAAMRSTLKASKTEKKDDEQADQELPEISEGYVFECLGSHVDEKATKPPRAYTDTSILDWMSKAGRKDAAAEEKAAMTGADGKWKGIGTSATRASVIDNIVKTGYVERHGRKLLPTESAYALASAVSDEISDPSLTAHWETELAEVESGAKPLEEFIDGVAGFVKATVSTAKADPEILARAQATKTGSEVAKCPICGKPVVEKKRKYECSSNSYAKDSSSGEWQLKEGCGFFIWNEVAGKKIAASAAKALCEKGRTGTLKGFKSKKGSKFDASLVLEIVDDTPHIKFAFPDRPAGNGRRARIPAKGKID